MDRDVENLRRMWELAHEENARLAMLLNKLRTENRQLRTLLADGEFAVTEEYRDGFQTSYAGA